MLNKRFGIKSLLKSSEVQEGKLVDLFIFAAWNALSLLYVYSICIEIRISIYNILAANAIKQTP